MNTQKLISLLGLAQKAGKLVSGEFAVDKAVKSGKVKIIILAEDASEATKKQYKDLAQYYNVLLYESLSKQQLGMSIGKEYRAAVAITDASFSKAVIERLQ